MRREHEETVRQGGRNREGLAVVGRLLAVLLLASCDKLESRSAEPGETTGPAQPRKTIALAEPVKAIAPADANDAWLDAAARKTTLRTLILGKAKPSARGWSAIGRMRLTKLSVTGAVLDAHACKQIAKLAELDELELLECTLKPAGLRQLAKFSRLTDLDLSGAEGLVGRDFAPIGDLESLRVLGLAGTAVDDETLSHFHRLKYVWLLVLRGTKITDAGLTHLAHMESIATLYLNRTGVRGCGVKALAPLGKLAHLYLDSLDLDPATLKHLSALKGLEDLGLSCTPTTDDALVHLAGLKYLGNLDLYKTKVTDVGLRHLAGLIQLWHLWLPAGVKGAGLVHLHKLRRLETLILQSEPTPDVLSAFRTAVPDCEVSFD